MLITDFIPKLGELPLFTDYDSISKEVERIIGAININGPINNEDLEALAYIKEFHPNVFQDYESSLMFSLGLFYKTSEPKNLWDIAFDTFAKAIKLELNDVFTPVQASAYKQIGKNKYFSFSAPTSAGKSHLFRKLIKDEVGDILIVLPSRALIAEYLILVREALADIKNVLILQFIENINQAKTTRRVYIVTPERCKDLFRELRKPNNSINVSLVLFDEAQISEEPIRGVRFDSLVRRINTSIPNVKIVFTHPFIDNPEAQLSKHNQNFAGAAAQATSYKQNVVGKIFIFQENNQLFHFSPYNDKKDYKQSNNNLIEDKIKRGKTLLIYVSKKSIYDRAFESKFKSYIDCCPRVTNPNALAIIQELENYLGVTDTEGEKYSLLIDLMGRGVVIHHGSIPLRARLLIEEFIKKEYARICFCTSTLQQGVNMPFDIVWIDNFRFDGNGKRDKEVNENIKALALKNLIGRAGRSSNREKDCFDYGYVLIEKKNLNLFRKRIKITPNISPESLLDSDLSKVDEDAKDIVEAIKNNTFDDETNLTQAQLDRISNVETMNDVEYILDTLFENGEIISGDDYYALGKSKQAKIREAFKGIFTRHLRRTELNLAEKTVLSASIPILLWQIRGKSFKEIISLRYSFLAEKRQIRELKKQVKATEISEEQAEEKINGLKVRRTQVAAPIPNSKLRRSLLFEGKSINEIDYDRLVCDTYDYIDKVISLSVSDPICAACMLYKKERNDDRADILINYLRYGTNDQKAIWLIKYGFTFEDIEWLENHVISVDEQSIVFADSIKQLEASKRDLISRYE